MISKCFVVITLISVIYSLFSGNFSLLTTAIIDGASKSVSLSIEMCGMAVFWCGIMQVFADSGILDYFCKILTPLLGRIFPSAWKNGVGKREIISSIGANILGIGNAATPYALSAMRGGSIS
ncbi:MAG: spore maturation protein, partial [Ruminococcaceae bacterium]|nr:spore maturation protein [Oscillospiraceae bacterium]